MSRLEVMTLASIVYEETRQSDEMPRIAGVYINRLRSKIEDNARTPQHIITIRGVGYRFVP